MEKKQTIRYDYREEWGRKSMLLKIYDRKKSILIFLKMLFLKEIAFFTSPKC
ncbi:hypothetical protein BGP_0278 [Beggiatoa sp. PS]|nr:hypothetical protein BGP_0278 [Beggiatoa sp. PS]